MKKAIMQIIAFCLLSVNVKAQTESNIVKINLKDFVKEHEDNGFVFSKKYKDKRLEFDTTINWIEEKCWFPNDWNFLPCIGIDRKEEDKKSDYAKMRNDEDLYSLHKEQKIKLQCLFDFTRSDDYFYKDCIIINKGE